MNTKNFREIFRGNIPQWTNTIVSKDGTTRNAIFSDDLFLAEDCPLVPSTWLNADRFQVKANGDIQQTTIQLFNTKRLVSGRLNPTPVEKGKLLYHGDDKNLCNGGFYEKDGKCFRRTGFYYEPVPEKEAPKVSGFLKLEAIRKKLLEQQRSRESTPKNDADFKDLLVKIREQVYLPFVKEHGKLICQKFLAQDPRFELTRRAYEDDNGNMTHFLFKRVAWSCAVPHITDIHQSVSLSISYRGRVDVEWILSHSSFEKEELINLLLENSYIFPDGDEYKDFNEYPLCDVYLKLDSLETEDLSPEQRDRCREILLQHRPDPLVPPTEDPSIKVDCLMALGFDPSAMSEAELDGALSRFIWLPMGSDFISDEIHQQYACDRFQALPSDVSISRMTIAGTTKWTVTIGRCNNPSPCGSVRSETIDGREIFTMILKGEKPQVKKKVDGVMIVDQQASEDLANLYIAYQNDFQEWLWSDKDRAIELCLHYNRKVNNFGKIRNRGDLLDLRPLNLPFEPYSYQRDAIYLGLVHKRMFLPLGCGAGKTLPGICLLLLARLRGISDRPVFVCPKNLKKQHYNKAMSFCPGANIYLVPDGGASRKELVKTQAILAHGDFDLYIMSYEEFDALCPLDPEVIDRIYSVELEELAIAAESPGLTAKELKLIGQRKQVLQTRIQKAYEDFQPIPGLLTFSQLGIKAVVLDEGHLKVRLLELQTRYSDIPGIATKGSGRSLRMFARFKHIQEHDGIIGMLTATPNDNSVTELYTWMRYFISPQLEQRGLYSANTWIENFCKVTTELDYVSGGRLEPKTKVRGIKNVDVLISLMQQFMILVPPYMMSQILQGRPEVTNVTVCGDPTPGTIALYDEISRRVDWIKEMGWKLYDEDPTIPSCHWVKSEDGSKLLEDKFSFDGHLQVYQHLLNASLDTRIAYGRFGMMEKFAFNDVSPKTKAHWCMYNVIKVWNTLKAANQKAIQMIFLDRSVDREGFFNLYEYIMRSLEYVGIKILNTRDETADNLARYAEDCTYDVFLTSTSKGGTGVEFQKNLIAIHELDVPPKGSSIVQRRGRIERVGNRFKRVFIFTYVTRGANNSAGADAPNIQRCQTKMIAMMDLLGGIAPGQDLSDMDEELTFSLEEIKAIASGTNLAMDLSKALAEKEKLESEKRNTSRRNASELARRKKAKLDIETSRGVVDRTQHLAKMLNGVKLIKFVFPDGTILESEKDGKNYLVKGEEREYSRASTSLLREEMERQVSKLPKPAHDETIEHKITIATIPLMDGSKIEVNYTHTYTWGKLDVTRTYYRLSYNQSEWEHRFMSAIEVSRVWDVLGDGKGSVVHNHNYALHTIAQSEKLLASPEKILEFDSDRLEEVKLEIKRLKEELKEIDNLSKKRYVDVDSALEAGLSNEEIRQLQEAIDAKNKPAIDLLLRRPIATHPETIEKIEKLKAIIDREATDEGIYNEQQVAKRKLQDILDSADFKEVLLDDITYEVKEKEESVPLELVRGDKIPCEVDVDLMNEIIAYPYTPVADDVQGKVDWLYELEVELGLQQPAKVYEFPSTTNQEAV